MQIMQMQILHNKNSKCTICRAKNTNAIFAGVCTMYMIMILYMYMYLYLYLNMYMNMNLYLSMYMYLI